MVPYLDKRLIFRLRIYTLVMIFMLLVISGEVFSGTFSVAWALGGILIGLGVGTLATRMYRLSWDEDTSHVISRIDWIGGDNSNLLPYLCLHQDILPVLLGTGSSVNGNYLQHNRRYHAGPGAWHQKRYK